MQSERDYRQVGVAEWCVAAFGAPSTYHLRQRALRLLEEAIEFYQAVGGDPHRAANLLGYVFNRPPGEPKQELGGVGVALLAAANAMGTSADSAEKEEMLRIFAMPVEHFKLRDDAKRVAGISDLPPGT